MRTIRKELDPRDRWMGIRRLKEGYKPQPYHRKTRQGEHIKLEQRAQETANFFGKEQWGIKEEDLTKHQQTHWEKMGKKLEKDGEYHTRDITIK